MVPGQLRPGHLLLLAALGCASTGQRADLPLHNDHLPGTWHFVAQGETSASIARQAGIPLEDFLEVNGLRKNQALEPGRPVFLLAQPPGPNAPAQPDGVAPPSEISPPAANLSASNAPLRWPMAAPRLTSPFGRRWGRDHDGIDMAAPIGTPVYAAAAGVVIYAGDQVRGYGNMVVVRHNDGMVTVYAHNSVLLAHSGDVVGVGQEIARVGETGRSTGPHLHFEVRREGNPQDPMKFLPSLK
jgi:lipoprotein NlpD